MSLVPLPQSLVPVLEPYLPPAAPTTPFVTLTYAQSVDSRIAASPGEQTHISHPETKTMTHYLRSRHDAILVGIGTVLADDPKLNCRYVENGNTSTPRPVVVDPHAKWFYDSSRLRAVCDAGHGLAPYILVDESVDVEASDTLTRHGGKYIKLPLVRGPRSWTAIVNTLYAHGLKSIMVEGGAIVINDLLSTTLVNSLVVTIGPVYLGSAGVAVSPAQPVALANVRWWTGTQDSVMCAKTSIQMSQKK